MCVSHTFLTAVRGSHVSTQAMSKFKIEGWDEHPYVETADFVGLQRVVGRVGERSGSLVLESVGTFDGKEANGPLTIIAGSGTGELKGIAGDGQLRAPIGGEPSVPLNYRFD